MGSSGPRGYATEIGQVVLMPLQLKSGGLASNYNIFAYVYSDHIFAFSGKSEGGFSKVLLHAWDSIITQFYTVGDHGTWDTTSGRRDKAR